MTGLLTFMSKPIHSFVRSGFSEGSVRQTNDQSLFTIVMILLCNPLQISVVLKCAMLHMTGSSTGCVFCKTRPGALLLKAIGMAIFHFLAETPLNFIEHLALAICVLLTFCVGI
jgi:hypothetical protein